MDGFTVTEQIHADADTVLCRAYRHADQARLALKRPRAPRPAPREIEKLRYEYTILRDLDVPGVLKAYGVEPIGESLAVLLEDPGARLLSHEIRERRLDLRTALEIAAALAETLDAVHRRHVIHKDVNPDNIAFDPSTGEVKLMGFGIATRLSQEDQRARSASALEGTLAYISPEQTGRMNRALDHRTDLYSLGVTLYQMLTGRLPFSATDPVDLVHSHIARLPQPPREIDPQIPAVVSDIVMKLLAKAADDRYQSGIGLARDLRACLAALAESGTIAPFPLGQHDFTWRLRIPQRLYGRDAELAVLLGTFERVRQGRAELLLVSGAAGVGKSVLVNEIHKPIAVRGGHFASGKFDRLSRAVPYAPIARAFRELVRDLLASPRPQLDSLRSELNTALWPIAQVLVDLIPELGLLLGPQPNVPELEAAEAHNRFVLAFQGLLDVLATPARPLVLFLDDLQWADPASLKLLTNLLTSPQRGHLLVIGAYRDKEVDAAHPLTSAIAELRRGGAAVVEMALGPLDAGTVAELVQGALGCAPSRAAPLVELVFETTHGNPFFIGQLLRLLHRDGLLTWNAGAKAWEWDIAGLGRTGITDDIVAFMAPKVKRLPAETQRVLKLAACIGHRFDLRTLSIISELPPRRAAAALWHALREGLVVPLDAEYRFLQGEDDPDVAPLTSEFQVSYRFIHDRVQEAATSLIDEGQRQAVHLQIGRLMRASRDAAGDDAGLFSLVQHLNLGAPLIQDRGEQLEVARLDLEAGRRAKQATAYDVAARTFAAGVELAGERGWEDDYDLTFALTMERAECEYLATRFDEAERLFDLAVRHARTRLERAQVDCLRVVLYLGMGKLAEAVAVGRRGLAALDVDLPEDPRAIEAALGAALAEVEQATKGFSIQDLALAPRMTDPEQAMALRILSNVFSAAYVVSPVLLALVAVRSASISIRHGNAEMSPFGYIMYGFVLSSMGRHAEAYEWGRLALALNERLQNGSLTCKLSVVFGMSINHCQRPLRTSIPYFTDALPAGRAAGDLHFLCYAAVCLLDAKLGAGEDLSRIRRDIEELGAVVEQTRTPTNILIMQVYRQLVAALSGRTRDLSLLADGVFDEAEFARTLERPDFATPRCMFGAIKAQLLLLSGDYEAALSMAAIGEACAGAATGYYFLNDLAFHVCLAILLAPPAEGAARDERAARLARHKARIEDVAAACPENFRHKRLLIAAEQARVDGDRARAIDFYDEAIEGARASGFVQDEALANELAGRFYLASGHPKIARVYLGEAVERYRAWGALAKARALEAKHKGLLDVQPAAEGARPPESQLDLLTVIKASQALSAEIDLDRVIEALMILALENVGAQRGYLLRARDDGLDVEAMAEVDRDEIKVRRLAGATAPALPAAILDYVRTTREILVLDDAATEPRFMADEVILRERPRSVLCLPLLRQGALVGLLYLENNLTAGAFPAERRALLEVLASQAAISLENGALYARLTQENAERRRAEDEARTLNRELERRVKERTAQLEVANRELAAFSYSVSHDLRSPLRAIDGFSLALLKDHGDALSGEARDHLLRLRKASRRMAELIEDMLHLSRVSQAEMQWQDVDLSAMAGEMMAEHRRAAPEREIDCVVAEGAVVRGDAKLLRIALQNLIDNAFKFTRKKPRARIEFGVREERGAKEYYVRDDGAGFDMQFADKLFGAFQRMHDNSDFEGTGIGLATVRRIVNRHGGQIRAEAEVGRGATFYFTLC